MSIPTPDRRQRVLNFGIDCCEDVSFGNWWVNMGSFIPLNWFREPGGEYIKQIVIKNVVMKTQKICYELPKTRFFSMNFPETVTLSAGMSWSVPITFRPVAKVGCNMMPSVYDICRNITKILSNSQRRSVNSVYPSKRLCRATLSLSQSILTLGFVPYMNQMKRPSK
jgi:hypothetical protein